MQEDEKSKEQKKRQQEGVENLIDSYKDRWGLKEGEKYYVSNHRAGKVKSFPSNAEVGDIWEDPASGKKYKKLGEDTWSHQSNRERFSMRECGKCGRYLRNINEANVNLTTGKCYKCHAHEETLKIGRGEEYKPPKWKSDIMFTNSFGEIVMSIDEAIKEYGDIIAHGMLTQLTEAMDQMREKGKRVNEPMYENAHRYMDMLEERNGGNIDHKNSKGELIKLRTKFDKDNMQKRKLERLNT